MEGVHGGFCSSRRTPNLPFELEPLTGCVLWHMTTFEQEKKRIERLRAKALQCPLSPKH